MKKKTSLPNTPADSTRKRTENPSTIVVRLCNINTYSRQQELHGS
jgi:hypothetical protein